MELPNYLCYFFALFYLFIRYGAYFHTIVLFRTINRRQLAFNHELG